VTHDTETGDYNSLLPFKNKCDHSSQEFLLFITKNSFEFLTTSGGFSRVLRMK
jgi:hypothetical protein